MYDDPGRDVGPKTRDLWKPVVAAVQGIACGGAFYMLGEVEFIIASDDAVFFDPHVTYGMTAAFEPMQMLSKMPFPEIMRMSLLGAHERMSARARPSRSGSSPRSYPATSSSSVPAGRRGSSPTHRRSSCKGPCGRCGPRSRSLVRRPSGLANLFTRIGSDAAAFKAGQERFTSGERVRWRLR